MRDMTALVFKMIFGSNTSLKKKRKKINLDCILKNGKKCFVNNNKI